MASEFQKRQVAAVFRAMDVDKDGYLERDEVTGWKGAGAADTSDIFHKLDLKRDGYISRREFAQRWREFWTGDYDASPSQFVFALF